MLANTPLDNTPHDLSVYTRINADYATTHQDMLNRTLTRIQQKQQGMYTANELWIVEHKDVYTLGQSGKKEHILQRGNTPIIQTDRGGQVTWHGKGQLVVYWLIDLNDVGWTVRHLVSHAEQSIEDVLNHALAQHNLAHQFYAHARQDAPGVYLYDNKHVMLGKIASLGFKIKHGFSYHGIALNLNCNLAAFDAINPCGYANMRMLTLADFLPLKHRRTDTNKPYTLDAEISNSTEATNSIATLMITQDLIDNITQRLLGKLTLR